VSTKSSSSVQLSFAAAEEPVSEYIVEYGGEEGDYRFATGNISDDSRNYLIGGLNPSTTYYFRIRASNGCAVGPWSNVISSITFGGGDTGEGRLEIISSELEEEKGEEEEKEKENYDVRVEVTDSNNNPVIGAEVTLYSESRTAYTNDQGFAFFENVEQGQHRVVIVYDGYEGEENIFLEGEDVKTFYLKVEVEPKEGITIKKNIYIPAIIVGALGLIGLAFYIRKLKK